MKKFNSVRLAASFTALMMVFYNLSFTAFAAQIELEKLLPEATGDRFGWDVAISGDGNYAIVGSYLGTGAEAGSGSAYVYVRSGSSWTLQQELVPADGNSDDTFGASVAISNDGSYVIVGAPYDSDNSIFEGSAYIFTRAGSVWTEQQKLTPNDGLANDSFGFPVEISNGGDTVIIGSSGSVNTTINGSVESGSAYVFTRSGSVWSLETELIPNDGASGDGFGYGMALAGSGDYALVSSIYPGSSTGKVYAYSRTGVTWSEDDVLTASDGDGGDYFGIEMDISSNGTHALIGATQDGGSSENGQVYYFTRLGSDWTEQQILTASDGGVGDGFAGVSMNSSGSYAIIGAYGDDDGASDAGAAYVFTRSGSTWSEVEKFTASDGAANNWFGYYTDVSATGEHSILSASGFNGTDGAAYLFQDVSAVTVPEFSTTIMIAALILAGGMMYRQQAGIRKEVAV